MTMKCSVTYPIGTGEHSDLLGTEGNEKMLTSLRAFLKQQAKPKPHDNEASSTRYRRLAPYIASSPSAGLDSAFTLRKTACAGFPYGQCKRAQQLPLLLHALSYYLMYSINMYTSSITFQDTTFSTFAWVSVSQVHVTARVAECAAVRRVNASYKVELIRDRMVPVQYRRISRRRARDRESVHS